MAGETICLEDEVIFGPYCVVVSSNHTRKKGSFRYGEPDLLPILVGKGSWVAAHVTLTAGSNIGQGTLVAAGAVVKGNIPSNVVIGGVPARMIGDLKDDCEGLVETQ